MGWHHLYNPKFLIVCSELVLIDLILYFLRQILTAATFCYLIYFQTLHNEASVVFLIKKDDWSAFASRKLKYYLVPKRARYTSNLELSH